MTVTSGSPTPAPTGSGTLTLAQIQQAFGSAATSGSGAGRVYMGLQKGRGNLTTAQLAALPPSELEQVMEGSSSDKWMATTDAENNYFTWNAKARRDFIAKGLLSGLLTTGAGDMEASALWKSLVDQAANYGANGAKVSPLDILSGYVKGNSAGGWIKSGDFETNPVTGEKRYIGPAFKTTTQTNADLTDPATARAIATSVFQDMLGRDPGQGEISAYAQALASSEQENPSTTTTTTQYDPTTGEATNAAAVTTGGVTSEGQQQLASDAIKKKKEYGATQAATTYMNALQAAVGGGS